MKLLLLYQLLILNPNIIENIVYTLTKKLKFENEMLYQREEEEIECEEDSDDYE